VVAVVVVVGGGERTGEWRVSVRWHNNDNDATTTTTLLLTLTFVRSPFAVHRFPFALLLSLTFVRSIDRSFVLFRRACCCVLCECIACACLLRRWLEALEPGVWAGVDEGWDE